MPTLALSLGCPGAARVDMPVEATGIRAGASDDDRNTAGRDITTYAFDFGGWATGGLAVLGWGVAAHGRRKRDHVAKTVVKAIERSECEICKHAVWIERDPVVNAFVEKVVRRS